jgi:hypothetical protein
MNLGSLLRDRKSCGRGGTRSSRHPCGPHSRSTHGQKRKETRGRQDKKGGGRGSGPKPPTQRQPQPRGLTAWKLRGARPVGPCRREHPPCDSPGAFPKQDNAQILESCVRTKSWDSPERMDLVLQSSNNTLVADGSQGPHKFLPRLERTRNPVPCRAAR